MASTSRSPKDSQVMTAILKDMGIIDYEPRVINQLLEFTYRYVTNILEDARVFSTHSKKKNVDVDDVKLSIQMQMDKSFTTPPPRDILIEISRQRNNMPLPLIKPHCGPRLPPDRYCLSSCNYRMKAAKKSRQMSTSFGSFAAPKINLNTVQSGAGGKIGPAISLASKTGSTLSLVTKVSGSSPTVNIVTRPAPTTPVPIIKLERGLVPSPIIKLTTSSAIVGAATTTTSGSTQSLSSLTGGIAVHAAGATVHAGAASLGASPQVASPIVTTPKIHTIARIAEPTVTTTASGTGGEATTPMLVTEASLKRKREPDEDYDV